MQQIDKTESVLISALFLKWTLLQSLTAIQKGPLHGNHNSICSTV